MIKTNTDREKIQELLTRGTEKVYPSPDFLKKLLLSDKQLSLYLGIDPTGNSLHLGHSINLLKLKQFQELGHKVIILVGDFTATIGDPTDKTATRQPLTRQQVLSNAKDYKKQASKFLDFTGKNKAEWRYNSQWLDKMKFDQVLDLSTNFTVQQLLERDMFRERVKRGRPISLHEFLYPVLQAYDCVAMKVDGELGGNDQTFNMLAGRTLMKSLLKKEKFVLTMKLLVDSSGIKMGKTEGNMAALDESPKDMFGKIMSWHDNMILPGFELCTEVSKAEVAKMFKEMKAGANPKDYKVRLAKEIATFYHSTKQANEVAKEFNKVFAKKEKPSDIKIYRIRTGKVNPADLLVKLKFTPSKSEARRLIEGGGFRVNDKKVTSWKVNIAIQPGNIVQAGKRKFGKIK